jgi:adenosylhomocysteine nucleosidase
VFQTGTCRADIGIITALDSTLKSLLAITQISETKPVAGRLYYRGNLANTPIVLVQSPMGMVNNSITAQLLISEFPVTAIVSISPAGALSKTLDPGDLVLVTKVFQHDFGTWKPYGFIWGNTPALSANTATDYNHFPTRWPRNIYSKFAKDHKLHEGILVSGDQFIASDLKRDWLVKKFSAIATDMGGAAIVQTGFSNNVPVTILRIITDRANNLARIDFGDNVTHPPTDIDVTELVRHFVQSLYTDYPGNSSSPANH